MSITNPGRLKAALFIAAAKTVMRPEYKRFVESLEIKGTEKVMDFGSGPGVMAEMIAQQLDGKGGRLTCVDISRNWIEIARKRLTNLPNIDFMLGDIRLMSIPEGSFDLIAVHFVLHDVDPQTRRGVVAALERALKPDGTIMIDEPLGRRHGMKPDEVRRLLGEVGLKEVGSRQSWKSYVGEFKKNSCCTSRSAS